MALSKPSSPTPNGSRPMTYCLESMKTDTDAAVIGMTCRTAGGNNPGQLWQSLLDQKDASSDSPPHALGALGSEPDQLARLFRRQYPELRRSVLWHLAKGG